jgi:type III secretory pathway component EscS
MPAHLALDAAFAAVMLLMPLIFSLPPLLAWASGLIGLMAAVLVATTKMR